MLNACRNGLLIALMAGGLKLSLVAIDTKEIIAMIADTGAILFLCFSWALFFA